MSAEPASKLIVPTPDEIEVYSKTDEKNQSLEDLKVFVQDLEFQLTTLRVIHGKALHELRNPDGTYVVVPILNALVNGHAAILNAQTKN